MTGGRPGTGRVPRSRGVHCAPAGSTTSTRKAARATANDDVVALLTRAVNRAASALERFALDAQRPVLQAFITHRDTADILWWDEQVMRTAGWHDPDICRELFELGYRAAWALRKVTR